MVSDFKDNWYLGVFWSEELVGNDEICSQGHFYEATIFKMAANKIVKLSMVWFQWKLISRDFEVRNWLVPWILIWGLFGNFCVCIQTQSNLVIIILPLLLLRTQFFRPISQRLMIRCLLNFRGRWISISGGAFRSWNFPNGRRCHGNRERMSKYFTSLILEAAKGISTRLGIYIK
jgi:hypothetical protein